ncbi:MAG: hypothetical protein Q9226_004544 [Calogaya cf. arnoldii]
MISLARVDYSDAYILDNSDDDDEDNEELASVLGDGDEAERDGANLKRTNDLDGCEDGIIPDVRVIDRTSSFIEVTVVVASYRRLA